MPAPADTPQTTTDQPLLLVLHGARGDLARRMVLPGLAELAGHGLLPRDWALVGTGRHPISDDEFADLVRESLEEFGDAGLRTAPAEELVPHVAFAKEVTEDDPGDLTEILLRLRDELGDDDQQALVVHYLAVPPSAFEPLTLALDAHGLLDGSRVVYEKPYGTSPESFRDLDELVRSVLEEDQIYRIDHFLGKEATQNLHVLRFANELFGGVWDRTHVEQVQIDVPEELDVAQRAEFYDATGAALDMIVTHLFQVAAEVAMEPPHGLDADHVGPAREAVMRCFRPLDPENDVVLGQFDGYRDIEEVDDESGTDTFVAARLWIDNDRWRDVPFLLRTGKRMAASAQRVTLVLRTPEQLFGEPVGPGRISLSLKGDGAIEVTTTVKRPGPDLALGTGTARLALDDVTPGDPLSPYASLLHDVVTGDRTLFTTAEGLAAAWDAFEPLLGDRRPAPLPYAPGSWGPEDARRLAEPVGWVLGS
ncbi:glucose-6-phosphate dehydrogenase [Sanguibacter suaedae]|uniref:Glucose-6-phosphate 1-dehydrogenase n=1 Tax=Sanguibacter suaedae TaxID=2795737 RepID=A0A934I2I5_9MICO|nr:glucose-6-phosphate dehydrogenase [Sanguibacter suaedae]MBI9114018.1 glucose-6-phosphate dehydrogenase [Sanguibacter suaedae]